MPTQYLDKAQMKNEPVLIRRFSLNQHALHAQEYLKDGGVESFIFMDATWSGDGETQQGIRLVVKPSDANKAFSLLHAYDTIEEANAVSVEVKRGSKFYLQAAWFVSILFAFLLGSFLTDKALDGPEMVVGCIFLAAATYFFYAASPAAKKHCCLAVQTKGISALICNVYWSKLIS